jgi:hypothetical protein
LSEILKRSLSRNDHRLGIGHRNGTLERMNYVDVTVAMMHRARRITILIPPASTLYVEREQSVRTSRGTDRGASQSCGDDSTP